MLHKNKLDKALVTGATGFLGKNLVPFIKKKNKRIEVTSVTRNSIDEQFFISYKQLFLQEELQFPIYIHLAGKAHDLKNTSDDSEYFEVNYELTKSLYKRFLKDDTSNIFIFISSVKAVADSVEGELTEKAIASPVTAYGKSKLKAEQYILNNLDEDKTVVILRPCMIHGPGNKGNLNLLYSIICRGIPWPLGAYDNSRSFLSIDNLSYVINEILQGNVKSGVYNIADDQPLSTVELVQLIAEVCGKKSRTLHIPKPLIGLLAKVGNVTPIPINEERLEKLTENYVVSNMKLKKELGIKEMPVSAKEGFAKTLQTFQDK